MTAVALSQVWWHRPLISALHSLRQGDTKVQRLLGYTARPCLMKQEDPGRSYRYETPRTSSPACISVPQLSGVQPGGDLGNRLIPGCEPSPSSALQAVDPLRARYFGSVPCVPRSGLYSRTTEVAKASSGSGLPEPERTDLETHSQGEVLQTPGPAPSEEEQASRRLFQLCHQTPRVDN